MSHAADAADAGLMTRCDRIVGGASRDRTDDLRVANATLSQLSYGPVGLNLMLDALDPCSYGGSGRS